jgi:uncharacterized membrane protein YesL
MYAYRERYPRLADFVDGVSTVILANLLWILLSAPVVTLPAATAGLFAAMAPWSRGQTSNLLTDFFGAMRRHWRTSIVVVVLDLVIAGIVYVDFMFLTSTDTLWAWLALIVVVLAAEVALMANLYLWPLLVTAEELALRTLLATSVRLALGRPLRSVFLTIVALVPFALAWVQPFLLMVMTFSTCALLINWGTGRVILQHLTEIRQANNIEPQHQQRN